MKKYPHLVCNECGVSANVLTCLKKYKAPPKQLHFELSTYHENICEVCGEKKMVSESRDFFYPDFSLLEKNWILKIKKETITGAQIKQLQIPGTEHLVDLVSGTDTLEISNKIL